MSKEPNIYSLPNADTSAVAAETLKRMMPDLVVTMPIIAEIRYANYKAHIDKGFTEDQALKLCDRIGIK